MKNLLIKKGLVVTQNPRRDIIKADILIEDGKIKEISNNIHLYKKNTQVINATNKLILPGLINCHLHSDSFVYKGMGDNLRLFEQLKDPILNSIWDNLSKENLYFAALSTYCECIKNGITFVNDVPYSQFFIKELIKAMKRTKIRGAITSFDHSNGADIDNRLFIKLCEDANIMPIMHLPSEESMDTKKLNDFQDFFQYLKQGHISECIERINIIKKKYNTSSVELLNNVKLVNSLLQIVHGNHLTENDIKLIKKHNSKLLITPSTELKLQDGIYDIRRLTDRNILIGLGTDGSIWNNSNDIFREMKILLLNQNGLYGVKSFNAQKALDMATIDGAKCFGIDDKVGSIEEGKEADIILLELNNLNLLPLILKPRNNIVSNIVYCAVGSDVTHTIIKGKLIMENRKLLFLNEDWLLLNIQDQANKLIGNLK
ncbi:MAG: amidohydrolase family protein [Bacteroidetes bacterium]|nr:amidohydrolase family protein [Bacteroidota bacterium]